jgi:nitrogen regulatory protein PII 1
MIMIRAIVRPEKSNEVMKALMDAGFPAVTKMEVFGRGKQRGLKCGEVTYDELPKDLLLIVAKDEDKDFVIRSIMESARSGERGAFGDGKIFVSPVDEAYTISSGNREISIGPAKETAPAKEADTVAAGAESRETV